MKKFHFLPYITCYKEGKRESTDHDHGVGERGNVVKDDGVKNGTPQTNTLQRLRRQLGAAREVKVHEATTALPSLDAAETARSEVEAVSQAQVVQVATATGMEQRPRSGMEWRRGITWRGF